MLEVRSLKKSFGSKQVLFGIDFQGRPGRILGLVGKNGAGKTTIFHSILKFLEYQGEISLDGQDIRQETYARIGYLPEERSLMPKLTVCRKLRLNISFQMSTISSWLLSEQISSTCSFASSF